MKLSEQLRNAGGLLDATSALSNWRAMTLLAGTFVSSTLVLLVFMAMHNGFMSFIGGLLFMATMFYGANAVGIALMDAAADSPRSLMDTVMASLYSSHRLIGFVLAAALFIIVLLIVTAIALFICKIPVIGTVLTIVVVPVAALVVGMSFFALNFVLYPMAAAAVWSGLTLKEAISHVLAICRQKLLSVVIQEVLLMMLVGLVSLFIGFVIFNGLFIVGSMATGILSPDGAMGMLRMGMMGMGRFHGEYGGGFGGGYGGEYGDGMGGNGKMIAIMIGAGLLIAIGMIIPGLIAIQGYCQIFLSSLVGLDVAGASALLDKSSEAMRKKQEEIRQKMEEQRIKRQQMAETRQAEAAAKAAALATAATEVAEPTQQPASIVEEAPADVIVKTEDAAELAAVKAAEEAAAAALAKAEAEKQEAERLAALKAEEEAKEAARLAEVAKREEEARLAAEVQAAKAAAEALAKADAEKQEAERLAALKAEEEAKEAVRLAEVAKREEEARIAAEAEAAKAAAEALAKAEAEKQEAERLAALKAEEEAKEAARLAEVAKREEEARIAAEAEAAKAAAEALAKAEAEKQEAERLAALKAEEEAAAAKALTECPACHTPLEDKDANFCGECGHRLKS
ncbi:zinc ribbon domain-containing protein [Leeia sp. TBRC 13508]|uniref:Zinc ribbon domain-containing protein n=1 Tax=Leeia speluncae TaxID=2884804 RepID=A0ABS8D4F5_9NEIS|nr:zinc ribbon domain-containing protein [Leeia speluncae]MCB6183062.1 zinc ribbon domain-containing protein [Leeia speluncae]